MSEKINIKICKQRISHKNYFIFGVSLSLLFCLLTSGYLGYSYSKKQSTQQLTPTINKEKLNMISAANKSINDEINSVSFNLNENVNIIYLIVLVLFLQPLTNIAYIIVLTAVTCNCFLKVYYNYFDLCLQ